MPSDCPFSGRAVSVAPGGREPEVVASTLSGAMRMNDRRLKWTLLTASVAWILFSSGVQAQQAAPGELEALKKLIQEVVSENQDLKKRVRDLEEAMKARGPAEGTKEVTVAPAAPAEPTAPEVPPGPPKAAREKIQLGGAIEVEAGLDRKSTRLNSSHSQISYAVFCLKKKNIRIGGLADTGFQGPRTV